MHIPLVPAAGVSGCKKQYQQEKPQSQNNHLHLHCRLFGGLAHAVLAVSCVRRQSSIYPFNPTHPHIHTSPCRWAQVQALSLVGDYVYVPVTAVLRSTALLGKEQHGMAWLHGIKSDSIGGSIEWVDGMGRGHSAYISAIHRTSICGQEHRKSIPRKMV